MKFRIKKRLSKNKAIGPLVSEAIEDGVNIKELLEAQLAGKAPYGLRQIINKNNV